MRSFWRDFLGLDDVHLPKGPLLSEDIKAFGAMEFPDITPLELPPIKPLTSHVVKAKRAKREKAQKPVLQMRRKA